MELAAYTELIKLIPCEDQAFETKRKTWEPYKNSVAFKEFYKHTFNNKDTVIFSRRDLFSFAETDVNSGHADPLFRDVDPSERGAIIVRA